MTREDFIKLLDNIEYSYRIDGDKIIITHEGHVNLASLETLPPGLEFNNGGYVYLSALKTLHPDVEFKNNGHVYLDSLQNIPPGVEFNNGGVASLESLIGGWIEDWVSNIEGIDSKGLLNLMIKRGVFI